MALSAALEAIAIYCMWEVCSRSCSALQQAKISIARFSSLKLRKGFAPRPKPIRHKLSNPRVFHPGKKASLELLEHWTVQRGDAAWRWRVASHFRGARGYTDVLISCSFPQRSSLTRANLGRVSASTGDGQVIGYVPAGATTIRRQLELSTSW
jgi:hypothetical protein